MELFKKLRGRRILLIKPVLKESSIELSAETKAALEAENMKQWTALEVFAVGDDVEEVKAGDKVYVPTYGIQQAEIIDIDKVLYLIISEGDVAIIW
jgi:co-chaperonin GroES (HSP10)